VVDGTKTELPNEKRNDVVGDRREVDDEDDVNVDCITVVVEAQLVKFSLLSDKTLPQAFGLGDTIVSVGNKELSPHLYDDGRLVATKGDCTNV